MKTLTRLMVAATVCAAMLSTEPLATERGRKEYGTQQTQNRPAQQRPGGSNNHQQQRPGNQPGTSQRPGNQPNNNYRPGNQPNNNGGHRPGAVTPPAPGNHRPHPNPPSMGHNPGNRPTPPPPVPNHRPQRPTMPGNWVHWRPTPPPVAYRPYNSWPRFSTVLGVRFGASIALSLEALFNAGYNVIGNYNNVVYLQNVPMLGVYWPEATLSYTGAGRLTGSEFVNYSNWANTSLYNRLYSQLCASYGMPYSNTGSSAAWWGPDGQYIRLNFSNGMGYDGTGRFYTTLNFGIY